MFESIWNFTLIGWAEIPSMQRLTSFLVKGTERS